MRQSVCRAAAAALLVCLAGPALAQPQPQPADAARWLARLETTDLAGLATQLSRPGETWPALGGAPVPLAIRIHQKIKEAEGEAAPGPDETGPRVRLYADLAKRFRAAGGYSNHVLADTLTMLSVLHLARLLDAYPQRVEECSELWTILDAPALSERIFQEVYRSKVGPRAALPAGSPAQMLATIAGWPPEDLISQGTGALLKVTNPKAFLFRFISTALFGRSALGRWIEFVRKGGRTEDLAAGRGADFDKLFPPDYHRQQPEALGDAGAAAVTSLILMARNPEGQFLSWALDGPRRARQSRFQITERVIGKVNGFRAGFGLTGSPDMRHYYLLEAREPNGSGQTLTTERFRSKLYDGISGISFNRQSTRLAFIGHRAGQAYVVVDGVESSAYDRGTVEDLQFSPDGRHVAFLAQRGGVHFVVADGREGAPQPDVTALAYSPAGELAWMVRRQGLWRMLYRGRESAGYPGVNGPMGITFSPDGRYWAYQMREDGVAGYLSIVEGAASAAYPGWASHKRPVFSADNRRVLFEGTANPDGVEVQIAELGNPPRPPFVATGTAVHVTADLRRVAVVDRIPGPPGGKSTHRLNIDGRRWEMQSQTEPLFQFSPLGTRFTLKGDELLIDGRIEGEAGETGPWSATVFSPDDRSFAYVRSIRTGATPKHVVVRDGKPVHTVGLSGGEPAHLTFSPDGRRLAYVVPKGPGYAALAVDGEEAPPIFDYVPYNSRLVFDAPNRFHTLACRNGEVIQVDVTWPAEW